MRRRILFSVSGFLALYLVISVILSSIWPNMPSFLYFLLVFVLPLVIVIVIPENIKKKQTNNEYDNNSDEYSNISNERNTEKDENDLLVRERRIAEKEAELSKREVAIEEQYSLKNNELSTKLDLVNRQLQNLRSERMSNEYALHHTEQYQIALEKTERRVLSWVKLRDAEDIKYFDEIRAEVDRYQKYSALSPEMDGFKFEEHIANLLIDIGYTDVTVTQKSRDFGADITAMYGGARYVFQCKFYSSPVGIDAVQQVYSSKPVYSAHVAVVVTNNVFTKAAKILADEVGVILWDCEKLAELTSSNK